MLKSFSRGNFATSGDAACNSIHLEIQGWYNASSGLPSIKTQVSGSFKKADVPLRISVESMAVTPFSSKR
jgi:hypothetical protein